MSKVNQNEEEVVTQEIRGTKECTAQGNPDTNREGGHRNTSLLDGDFSSGTFGEDWERSIVTRQLLITGGILTRLIRQAEQKIKEHDDCIIWYQEQKQKDIEELEELKSLQKLVLESQGSEGKESLQEELNNEESD